MTPPRVVVTGPSGHLGTAVVHALLSRGWHVRALCYGPTPSLDGLDIERVEGDVRDRAGLERAFAGHDVVVHLAGVISLREDDDALMRAVNVDGCRNAARAALAAGVGRFVHLSSVHAYRTEGLDAPLTESGERCGADAPAYDRSKAAGDVEIEAAIADGLDAVVLCPTGVIGPHDPIPSHMGGLLRAAYSGRVRVLPRGAFPWVDVRDVADAVISSVHAGHTGDRYLLAGPSGSIADLARHARRLGGHRGGVREVPLGLVRAALPIARRFGGSASTTTDASLRALASGLTVDATKAERALGFHPRPAEDSVRDAIVDALRTGALPRSRHDGAA